MTPLEYLAKLQGEALGGFHPVLRVWVDDASSVAKVLREYHDLALSVAGVVE